MALPRRGWSKILRPFYDYLEAGGVTKEVATGLAIDERGVGPFKQTLITLSGLVVPVTSVTTGNGVGGKKLFTFPAGRILHLGTMAQLSCAVDEDDEDDFTDETPEGDVGIGTLAPANADALGTDATDDNLATAAAFTMADFADPSVSLTSEPVLALDGTTTPVPVFLNHLVDAADIDDGVASSLLWSGTIRVSWVNLGDVG